MSDSDEAHTTPRPSPQKVAEEILDACLFSNTETGYTEIDYRKAVLIIAARDRSWEEELRAARERYEQAECQLAGCMTAAMGWALEPPKQGDWGWSASFQEVLNLRQKWEALRAELQREREKA